MAFQPPIGLIGAIVPPEVASNAGLGPRESGVGLPRARSSDRRAESSFLDCHASAYSSHTATAGASYMTPRRTAQPEGDMRGARSRALGEARRGYDGCQSGHYSSTGPLAPVRRACGTPRSAEPRECQRSRRVLVPLRRRGTRETGVRCRGRPCRTIPDRHASRGRMGSRHLSCG